MSNRLLTLVSALSLGGLLLGQGVVLARLSPGTTAPLLDVKVVAGANAGSEVCVTCTKSSAVVFLTKTDNTIVSFLKQFDDALRAKGAPSLAAVAVFTGAAAQDTDKLKQIARTQGLTKLALAVPSKADQLPEWKLDAAKAANAYVVSKQKVTASFATGAPYQDGLAAKLIAKARDTVD
jgi:hypothetical protein